MNTKKTNNKKKSQDTDSVFPCGDFQKMAEMMKNCCPNEGGTIDCCSMMKKMMERNKQTGGREPKETRKPPKGGENA